TQSICTTSSATLSGNSPTVGSGSWTVESGPSTSSSQFGNTSTHNTTFTPAGGAGNYIVRWTITNSPCTSSYADATITTLNPTTATVDWNKSNVQEITLSTYRTFTFINGKSGGVYTLLINQNTSGGWTVTWPANIKWAGGIAPTLNTTANASAQIRFIFNGINYLEGGIYQY
ncbi:MAG: hypothetical protein HGB12_01170, partial [Bacteroidetes bacterium]|nr:hypothetical protein [Bacteroidota bacterium]